jgi:hypothetical protein
MPETAGLAAIGARPNFGQSVNTLRAAFHTRRLTVHTNPIGLHTTQRQAVINTRPRPHSNMKRALLMRPLPCHGKSALTAPPISPSTKAPAKAIFSRCIGPCLTSGLLPARGFLAVLVAFPDRFALAAGFAFAGPFTLAGRFASPCCFALPGGFVFVEPCSFSESFALADPLSLAGCFAPARRPSDARAFRRPADLRLGGVTASRTPPPDAVPSAPDTARRSVSARG